MIRWKVFLPVFGFVILVGWFLTYRADAWLKNQIEKTISAVTGTKTDVQSLRLSFLSSRLDIGGLQIASSKEEFKNAIDIEEIIVDFEALPLLEKRFVIEDVSVKSIAWGTARRSSGFLPEEPEEAPDPSWYTPWVNEATNRIEEEFAALPVTKLADFRVPTDPVEVLNDIELESSKALQEAIVSIQRTKTDWQGRIAELRDLSEYETVYGRARAAVQNLPSEPKQILSRASQIEEVIQFFKQQRERAEKFISDIQNDYRQLERLYVSSLAAIDKDFERAKGLISLAEFDLENLARLMFGPQWLERVELVLHYHGLLREKLAQLQTPDEQVQVRQRAQGRDIIFVVPEEKPRFVWKRSELSVTGFEREGGPGISQSYALQVEDVNSNPRLYGEPTKVNFLAKFKNFIFEEARADLFWDYTGEVATDRYEVAVEAIEARSWPVGIPRIFPVKIESGSAQSKSSLEFVGKDLRWVNEVNFSNVRWDLREVPNIGFIVPAMTEVLRQIRSFRLEIEVLRKNGIFDFQVRSDLDKKFQSSISDVIEARWQDFQQKLRAQIKEEVEVYQNQAKQELSSFENDIRDQVQKRLELAKKYQAQAQEQLNRLQDRAKRAAEQKAKAEAEKQLEKLKKDLPKPDINLPF